LELMVCRFMKINFDSFVSYLYAKFVPKIYQNRFRQLKRFPEL
jgi:hypothetical protein